MVPAQRAHFNQQFTEEKYQALIADINRLYPGQLDFRIAETPVFIPKDFTQKMLDACEHIIDVITSAPYQAQSHKAIPPNLQVPNEDAFSYHVCLPGAIPGTKPPPF
jgi:hypothetical protein